MDRKIIIIKKKNTILTTLRQSRCLHAKLDTFFRINYQEYIIIVLNYNIRSTYITYIKNTKHVRKNITDTYAAI